MLNDVAFHLFSWTVKLIDGALQVAFIAVPVLVAILMLRQLGWL